MLLPSDLCGLASIFTKRPICDMCVDCSDVISLLKCNNLGAFAFTFASSSFSTALLMTRCDPPSQWIGNLRDGLTHHLKEKVVLYAANFLGNAVIPINKSTGTPRTYPLQTIILEVCWNKNTQMSSIWIKRWHFSSCFNMLFICSTRIECHFIFC